MEKCKRLGNYVVEMKGADMQEVFSRIIEKLEERTSFLSDCTKYGNKDAEQQNKSYSTMMMYEVSDLVDDLIEIVRQEADKFGTDTNVGSNGWIPVSERLPDEAFGCLVTVMDCEPSTQTEFENILPYFVGYDGETWNDADGEEIPFEVIAWQKLPQPYQTKGE